MNSQLINLDKVIAQAWAANAAEPRLVLLVHPADAFSITGFTEHMAKHHPKVVVFKTRHIKNGSMMCGPIPPSQTQIVEVKSLKQKIQLWVRKQTQSFRKLWK